MVNGKKGETKEKMSMRLDINGSLKEKFEYLKRYLEMPTNTAVLRHLINIKYEELKHETEE